MKRIIALLICLMISVPAFAASQWQKIEPAGTRLACDIDYWVADINNEAMDRMVGLYRKNCAVTYDSASTLHVEAGEIAIPDSTNTIVRLRKNTAQTDVTWANIDAGAEAGSTQYYVYALADSDATTFTVKISTSASAPAGATYYRMIGYFYNDASSNIVSVGNVKGGDAPNLCYASAVTDISTTSAAFVDMTDMVVYFYSTGRPVIVLFSCGTLYSTGDGTVLYTAIDVDGTDKLQGYRVLSAHSMDSPHNLIWSGTLASGTHTIKVQWKTDGTGYQKGATYGGRILQVIEL